ncbi:MAG: stage III sporulation protein AA [Limnochordaceae bacterium]|nr:stage III sporulation protein AA [Limnochordaceae bacterium]
MPRSGPSGGVAWRAAVLPLLPEPVRSAIESLPHDVAACVLEIRVRAGRPLMVVTAKGQYFAGPGGLLSARPDGALVASSHLVQSLVDRLASGSLYAVGEELRQGFLTLPGGHRVGLGGRVVVGSQRNVQALTDFSSVVLRMARAVEGAAEPLVPALLTSRGGRRTLASTLVVSPPGAGKTTLLRDLARVASSGLPAAGLEPAQVVIIDERSELAGCVDGLPQHDVGPRTDVLDRCPKAEGVVWALRSLGPDVLVTDEVGSDHDVEALQRAAHAGCTILASAHAWNLAEARRRPGIAALLHHEVFERVVVLSRRRGPGTVEQVARTVPSAGEGEV